MRKTTETKTSAKKRLQDSRIFWAVLSVFLSLIIWVYYGSNYGTEMTRTFSGVEVTYVGRDALRDSQSLVISSEETKTVTVTLTGSRREISKLTSDSLKAVVNLSTVASSGYRAMSYTISYPTSVNTANIRETNKLPQTVGLQISKLMTRIVDFKCRFDGTMAEGYTLDFSDITFDPAYITLMGPEEELNQIDSAFVVLDRDNVSATFTAAANYNFVNADGETLDFDDVTADAEMVTVTVPVNMTKEVALDVSLIEGGGATAQNVITSVSPQTITVAGDSATLDGINTIYLATVDLSDYISFPQTEYSIVLPNGTENISGTTTATVNMEFTGLDWAYYTVTNLDYTNLEEGYTADVMDVTLVVMVRAPADVLSQIEANNIRAVADLTGVTTTSKVPVTVYVDGYTEAGAVGDYTLYVRVAPDSEAAG
ncbi:MAG: YbbR-like domain-containing protein [Oscillospiraceae bacterium]